MTPDVVLRGGARPRRRDRRGLGRPEAAPDPRRPRRRRLPAADLHEDRAGPADALLRGDRAPRRPRLRRRQLQGAVRGDRARAGAPRQPLGCGTWAYGAILAHHRHRGQRSLNGLGSGADPDQSSACCSAAVRRGAAGTTTARVHRADLAARPAGGERRRRTAHRPWPLPERPWLMAQTWHDLLFVALAGRGGAAAAARTGRRSSSTVSRGGATSASRRFASSGLRARGLLPLPWCRRFLELNVRTYVTAGRQARDLVLQRSTRPSRLAVEVGAARLQAAVPPLRRSPPSGAAAACAGARRGPAPTRPYVFEGRYRAGRPRVAGPAGHARGVPRRAVLPLHGRRARRALPRRDPPPAVAAPARRGPDRPEHDAAGRDRPRRRAARSISRARQDVRPLAARAGRCPMTPQRRTALVSVVAASALIVLKLGDRHRERQPRPRSRRRSTRRPTSSRRC